MNNTTKNYVSEVLNEELSFIIWVPLLVFTLVFLILRSVAGHSYILKIRKFDPKRTTLMKEFLKDDTVEVYMVPDKLPNAFTEGYTPTMYYTEGLSKILTQKEEMAVYCHEYGHYKEHHIIKQNVGFMGITLALAVLLHYLLKKGLNSWLAIILYYLVPQELANRLLSKPEEYVADSYAFKYGLGRELASALKKMEAVFRGLICQNFDETQCDRIMQDAAKSSTHPATKDRIDRLMKSKPIAALMSISNPSLLTKAFSLIKNKFKFGATNEDL